MYYTNMTIYIIISFILHALILTPILIVVNIQYVGSMDIEVIDFDISNYGVVINNGDSIILVTNEAFYKKMIGELGDAYSNLIEEVDCMVKKISNTNDLFVVDYEIDNIPGNVSIKVYDELGIKTFVRIPPIKGDCPSSSFTCPITLSIYINNRDYSDEIVLAITDIVNDIYRNTTYYKKGYCRRDPHIIFIKLPYTPGSIIDYINLGKCDDQEFLTDLLIREVKNIDNENYSSITNINGCYLVEHGISGYPIPYNLLGIYCKDYKNFSSKEGLKDFVNRNRDKIIALTNLFIEKGCIVKGSLTVVLLRERPYGRIHTGAGKVEEEHVESLGASEGTGVHVVVNNISTGINEGINNGDTNNMKRKYGNESTSAVIGKESDERGMYDVGVGVNNLLIPLITIVSVITVLTILIKRYGHKWRYSK